jgi:DME family drug/metabolite transporter
MRDRPLLLGSLVVVVAATGFGLLGPLANFSYDAGFEPLSFVAWRAFFGFLVVAVVVGLRVAAGRPFVNPLRLDRRDGAGLIIVALASLGLNVAMFFAFDLTTVALVLIAFYTYPALVAVVAVVLGHERLDRLRWIALLLALGGMVLVLAGGLTTSDGGVTIRPLGILFGLAAAASQTVFVTASRGRFRTVPSEQAIFWVLLATAAACAVVAIATGDPLDLPFRSPRALGLVAFTGIVAAGIPSLLFLVGIRTIGGTRAGILMLIEPVIGVALAALLLHEGLVPVQVLGGIAILGAALLLQRGTIGGEAGDAAGGGGRATGDRPEPMGVAAAERT